MDVGLMLIWSASRTLKSNQGTSNMVSSDTENDHSVSMERNAIVSTPLYLVSDWMKDAPTVGRKRLRDCHPQQAQP